MDQFFIKNVWVSIDELTHVIKNFLFTQFLFNSATQITLAQFGDNVGIVFGSIDFMEVEDIRNIS